VKVLESRGKVYVVGAGPGDPGLLTLKGLRVLESADVVVYDHLINPSLLDLAPPSAERCYAGKAPGAHPIDQEEINRLLADRAQAGNSVVRLKGGDPFIFGRGGEEVEYLAEHGIPFEIVPGVTSAVAVPAYAGIPLTHRDLASNVVFLTGHKDTPTKKSTIRWAELAKSGDTIVVLMGLTNLPNVARTLIHHGRSPNEPVAVIRWGTTAEQRTVTGTLATIADIVEAEQITPPAVVVIGRVVGLRDHLKWYEQLPLFGKRIVVTRPRHQSGRLGRLLEAEGAEVCYVPTIRIAPPESWEPLDQAIRDLVAFQWIVFTSTNGVEQFFKRLVHQKRDTRSLASAKVAAIGSETAESLRRHGVQPDLIPAEFRGEGLVAEFQGILTRGTRILLPAAAEARDLIPHELTRMGATVVSVPAYQTLPVKEGFDLLRREFQEGRIHVVTFTSSSSVRNFMSLLSEEEIQLLKSAIIAAIGPITAETVRGFGLLIAIMPEQSTVPALAEAIISHFKRTK
jgi:uroporphyrinogen III methyltransferase/synthase